MSLEQYIGILRDMIDFEPSNEYSEGCVDAYEYAIRLALKVDRISDEP